MPDQPHTPSKSLSEISHLFLSGIRERQTQGAQRPLRMPPPAPRTDMTVDLSPEEFAQVYGEKDAQEEAGPTIAPVRAVIASHLGPQQLTRVQEYASHLCPQGKRVGLIAVDASEFRLSIFEHNPHPQPATAPIHENEIMDPRKMAESLEELAWDVDEWLLLLPSPRAPEARSLLRDVRHWTLLTTCDHDGVVSCYRTLKGLSDLHRPELSIATLDASSDSEASAACQRMASVCRQFLDWQVHSESNVEPVGDVTEHVVLWCCAARDKAQLANAAQWQVVADFLAKANKAQPAEPASAPKIAASIPFPQEKTVKTQAANIPTPGIVNGTPPMPNHLDGAEVIDLPDAQSSPTAIVSAVLRGGHELVECPVKPPMCPDASLAVSRDHSLVLVAVARQGLSDLMQIGRAYQWLIENRALIGMAVPQMSIDAHQHPRLHLLVDHADMTADVLQPILQSDSVTVHAYRKLRWGGKTGLLLEAA
jgi:hypothetical protein